MKQDVLGLPVSLAASFDFSFLGRYGRPFCVLDGLESGNIAFGMQSERYGRLFVKFAGAPTMHARKTPEQAVETLRRAAGLYRTLQHSVLMPLLGAGEVAGGYALVFPWWEGKSLTAPEVRKGLKRQPLQAKLRMLDGVFDFHLHCALKRHVAVGFCSDHVLVDAATGRAAVCGIDLYRPMPAVNDCGMMPGEARFMAPEEYHQGAPLDGLTMQYAMGALAFSFLSQDASQELSSWTASPALYDAAMRAVSANRAERYPSLGAFVNAWRAAVRHAIVY